MCIVRERHVRHVSIAAIEMVPDSDSRLYLACKERYWASLTHICIPTSQRQPARLQILKSLLGSSSNDNRRPFAIDDLEVKYNKRR